MNIWLISIFEQTPIDNVFSTRFLSIANEAIARNHQVTFFASTFKHNTKNQRFLETSELTLADNYRLVFVRSQSYKSNISVKRLISHYLFSKTIIPELKKREKPNVILIAFPPVSLAYEISKWADQIKVPLVLDIIDPWPDTLMSVLPKVLKPLRTLIFWPLIGRLRSILGSVAGVTAISNQYLNWAKTYQPALNNLHCFYPAVDLKATQAMIQEVLQSDTSNPQSFSVVYAGSMASSYDIPCIIQAAEVLEKKYGEKIIFNMAGVGPQQLLVEQYITRHTNMRYFGRLPKNQLMKIYAHSHLGLIQHIREATQSVTYKFFDLLASGLPILNSLQSEMLQLIEQNQVGLNNAPGDYRTLADNIERFYLNKDLLQQYRFNAVRLTAELGDVNGVYTKMVDLLEKTAVENLL